MLIFCRGVNNISLNYLIGKMSPAIITLNICSHINCVKCKIMRDCTNCLIGEINFADVELINILCVEIAKNNYWINTIMVVN